MYRDMFCPSCMSFHQARGIRPRLLAGFKLLTGEKIAISNTIDGFKLLSSVLRHALDKKERHSALAHSKDYGFMSSPRTAFPGLICD
jgi:hypothetical protein